MNPQELLAEYARIKKARRLLMTIMAFIGCAALIALNLFDISDQDAIILTMSTPIGKIKMAVFACLAVATAIGWARGSDMLGEVTSQKWTPANRAKMLMIAVISLISLAVIVTLDTMQQAGNMQNKTRYAAQGDAEYQAHLGNISKGSGAAGNLAAFSGADAAAKYEGIAVGIEAICKGGGRPISCGIKAKTAGWNYGSNNWRAAVAEMRSKSDALRKSEASYYAAQASTAAAVTTASSDRLDKIRSERANPVLKVIAETTGTSIDTATVGISVLIQVCTALLVVGLGLALWIINNRIENEVGADAYTEQTKVAPAEQPVKHHVVPIDFSNLLGQHGAKAAGVATVAALAATPSGDAFAQVPNTPLAQASAKIAQASAKNTTLAQAETASDDDESGAAMDAVIQMQGDKQTAQPTPAQGDEEQVESVEHLQDADEAQPVEGVDVGELAEKLLSALQAKEVDLNHAGCWKFVQKSIAGNGKVKASATPEEITATQAAALEVLVQAGHLSDRGPGSKGRTPRYSLN